VLNSSLQCIALETVVCAICCLLSEMYGPVYNSKLDRVNYAGEVN